MRVVALLTLFASAPALAGTHVHLAASHEWGVPMSAEGSPLGPGIAAHVGPSFSLKIARLIPEIGATYHYETGVIVPRAGGRLIIGWILTPGVYAHANAAIGEPFAAPTPGFDAGISLHLSIPFVRVGGYGGIEVFGGESGPGIPDQNFIGGLEIALSIPLKKKADDDDAEEDEGDAPEEPLPEPADG
ncbi:MAG: hypothetical protein H6737_00485 [Alphaproteobacteria bacterium]|nr:hypothetical protein [Alphaproteobacteria bacterium]